MIHVAVSNCSKIKNKKHEKVEKSQGLREQSLQKIAVLGTAVLLHSIL